MKNKKGFMLADTFLGIVVIAMATASLLLFFNSLQSMNKGGVDGAMAINSIHNKIYMIDHESIGDTAGVSGIDGSTNIIPLFTLFKADALRIKQVLGGNMPEYSLENGLKASLSVSYSCGRFLHNDIGFRHISSNAVTWEVKRRIIKTLEDSMDFCDSISNVNNRKIIYFKD